MEQIQKNPELLSKMSEEMKDMSPDKLDMLNAQARANGIHTFPVTLVILIMTP